MPKIVRDFAGSQLMYSSKRIVAAALCLSTFFIGVAHSEALGIKVAPGTRIFPTVDLRALYDTNFFATQTEEEGALAVLFQPGLSIVKQGSRLRFEAGARGQFGEYDTGDQDDYLDSNIFAQLGYIATSRHRFRVRLERDDGHDQFGLRRTEGGVISEDRELDEFRDYLGSFRYRFGVPTALINLQYEFLASSREYETNQNATPTTGTNFLDFDRNDHVGTVFYNFSPKASLLFRASYSDIEFDETSPAAVGSRSADILRGLVGINWRATAKTSGEILVGVRERDPDDSAFSKTTGVDWEANVNWTPRPNTRFLLSTGRGTDESFLLNSSFIDTKEYSLAWGQTWTRRFSTTLGARYLDQEFESTDRQDDFYRYRLNLNYRFTQAVTLTSSFNYIDRDSTIQLRDFSKEVITVGFRYAL